MTSLRNKTITSLLWSLSEQLIRQGFQFVVAIILARFLSPSEFGLVAMVTFFTAFASAFIDSGFTSALIQKKTLGPDDADTVFYFNATVGLLMAIALYIMAPNIANFYTEPILKEISKVLAPLLFIGSLGGIHTALLSRAMDFKTQMRISVFSSAVAGFSSITAAALGLGVWCLVLQMVIGVTINTILLWILNNWKPRLVFNLTALLSLFKYGSNLLLSELLGTTASKLNILFIGKMYSTVDLGIYSRAVSIQQMPQIFISKVFNRVSFPAFSTASAENDAQFIRGGLKALDMLTMLTMPLMVGLLSAGPSLIEVVFGPKWLPCVPYLFPLCFAGLFWPFQALHLGLVKASGHSGLFLKLVSTRHCLTLLGLSLTSQVSVLAMAWSQVPVAIFASALNVFFATYKIKFPIKPQLRILYPHITGGVVVGFMVTVIERFWHPEILMLKLASEIFSSCIIYFAVTAAFHVPALLEIIQIFRKLYNSTFTLTR